jgi:hypothetical protein
MPILNKNYKVISHTNIIDLLTNAPIIFIYIEISGLTGKILLCNIYLGENTKCNYIVVTNNEDKQLLLELVELLSKEDNTVKDGNVYKATLVKANNDYKLK